MILVAVAVLLSGQTVENLPEDCAKAVTTLEIDACEQRDADFETERMERYLEAARTRARELDTAESWAGSTQQLGYLQNSQAVWAAYATIVCDGVYDHWKEGTIRSARYLDCRIEMTRERTHVIWRNYLTYADRTPPILPEPNGPATTP